MHGEVCGAFLPSPREGHAFAEDSNSAALRGDGVKLLLVCTELTPTMTRRGAIR